MTDTPTNEQASALLAKAHNAIATWQSNLLDLSRNNRLLKFRTTSLSAVPLVAPDLATIFERLVLEEQKLAITSAAVDGEAVQTADPSPSATSEPTPRITGLLSALTPERLSHALYNLRQYARSSIEERGVNILYIALGFVVWSDTHENTEWNAPLVLVPVALERTLTNRYVINAVDEDVILNPTLAYKLEREHGIKLPDYPDDLDGFSFEDFLVQLSQSLHDLKGATIKRDAFIGLFSFLKIPMYQDLARHTDLLLDHPLTACLAGLPTAGQDTPVGHLPSDLDSIIDPRATFQILDADSSQQEVLFAARQGAHVLIQGPPGTGKSQTITNLIGECLAEGKKVLFVSEKAAALEVVKRNLDQCGIGEACLELHSHQANKKKILGELQRVLEATALSAPADAHAKRNLLMQVRDELNAYVRALHQPRFTFNQSAFQVFGLFERVCTAPAIDMSIANVENLSIAIFNQQCSCLETLAGHAQTITDLAKHPWRGMKKRAPSLAFANEIRRRLESLSQSLQTLKQTIDELRQHTGLNWHYHLSRLKELVQVLGKYHLGILKLTTPDWQRFDQTYAHWWRFIYPNYWSDLKQIKLLCRPGWTPNYATLKADLALLAKQREMLGTATDFSEEPAATQFARIQPLLNQIEQDSIFLNALFDDGAPGALAQEQDIVQINFWCERHLASLERIDDYLLYLHSYDQAVAAGLGEFIAVAARQQIVATEWTRAYQRAVYTAWLDAVMRQAPELGFFVRAEHDKRIEQFRDLDKEQIRLARETIATRLAMERPRATEFIQRAPSAELNILMREFKKQRRAKSLRKLFYEASQVIQALKPCFMMSPLAVSQYLDPKRFHFDTVVFDEASQVRVEDAIGCIFRGKQLVVAGDSKQLPPTRFFDVMPDDFDWDEDTDDEGDAYESILDALETIPDLILNRMLFWHYRSRHEELIAFSNRNFYDNRLLTFPHPEQAGSNKPIEFVYVPEGRYERGGARKNIAEAKRVVDLVIQHAQTRPTWSLAVVTFSDAQRKAIQFELEQRLEQQLELKAFFEDNSKNEPFRIKNLELIQGDERDVILFSVGYGCDESGRPPSMNLGPLNKVGGRRRMNVAVTRARHSVIVVSSMQPEELARSENEGVRLLREYMLLSRDGLKALVAPTARANEPSLEESVYARLSAAGLEVHRQVGCSGYRIDLAVVDPKIPGRYCLAIECDGATYRAARTARDRDRLRQQILENLGWRVHRIWSRDWNANPEREIQRVLELIQKPAGEHPQGDAPPSPQPISEPSNSQDAQEQMIEPGDPVSVSAWVPDGINAVYYDPFRGDLHSKMDHLRSVADDIVTILNAQGPLHRDALIDPLTIAWGYQRLSKRVREIVDRAIIYAQSRAMVRVAHAAQFVYPMDAEPIKVRVPRPGTMPRPTEEISPEEMVAAIQLSLKEAGGSATVSDLVRLVVTMYGHQRAGSRVILPVQTALAQMEQTHSIQVENNLVRLADHSD